MSTLTMHFKSEPSDTEVAAMLRLANEADLMLGVGKTNEKHYLTLTGDSKALTKVKEFLSGLNGG